MKGKSREEKELLTGVTHQVWMVIVRISAYSACSLPGVVKEGVVKRDCVKRLRHTLIVDGCGGRPNNRIKVSTPCRLY